MHDYISNNECDLLILTETWLSDEVEENQVVLQQLLPDNYQIKHKPRSEGKGGGLGIIHGKSIPIVNNIRLIKSEYKQFESMSNLISFKNAPLASL